MSATTLRYSNPKITKHVEMMWRELGDVPVNENMDIQEDFGGFPKGTNAEVIWQWIEEAFDVTVHELMFPGEYDNKDHA